MSWSTDTTRSTATVASSPRGNRWIQDWRPADPTFRDSSGAKVGRRNLVFSALTEHIGFSVWTLWSVPVLFPGRSSPQRLEGV